MVHLSPIEVTARLMVTIMDLPGRRISLAYATRLVAEAHPTGDSV